MIAIGSDHGGYELKEKVKKHLEERGYEVKDFGTFSTESVDYPDIALPVAEAVAAGEYERGILLCSTGIGISIAANKVNGIRAAVCSELYSAEMMRRHNNANILCMGGKVVGVDLAYKITDLFLDTEFQGGRHQRRIDKIADIEKKQVEKAK